MVYSTNYKRTLFITGITDMQDNLTAHLIAQRRALGINMTELAELPNISQDKRVIADYERGRRSPALSYIKAMEDISIQYTILLKILQNDINVWYWQNPESKKLSLPHFAEFDDFKAKTQNNNLAFWRIWQAVVSHLAIDAQVLVCDEADIPSSMTATHDWLKGNYSGSFSKVEDT